MAASSDLRSLIASIGVQVACNRLQARGLNRRGVHATCVEVTDFLLIRTGWRVGLDGRFENRLHRAEVIVAKLRKRSPAKSIRRGMGFAFIQLPIANS